MNYIRNLTLSMTLALAFLNSPLSASTIQVSNLDGPNTFIASISGGPSPTSYLFAGRFTTDSQEYVLEEAQALLSNTSNVNAGVATFEARLYSDASAVPDALLATFDSNPTIASGDDTPTNLSFTTTGGFQLQASTSYWLAIRNTTGTYMGWHSTSSNTETTPGAWTIDDSAYMTSNDLGLNWSDRSASYGGDVAKFAVLASPVPEPSSVVLLAMGLFALGAILWTQQRAQGRCSLTK